jgi:flagellar capping protein FliD
MLDQVDKTKDTEVKTADSKDLLKKITDDIKEKSEKIRLYTEKLKNDIDTINTEKIKLENEIKQKVFSWLNSLQPMIK